MRPIAADMVLILKKYHVIKEIALVAGEDSKTKATLAGARPG
jgi:hypothetical protein